MEYAHKNILLIGLCDKFDKKVAKLLSNRLDMFYVDVNDYIEYELIDTNKMMDVCGVEYLRKQEKSIIKRLSTFENTLIHINYDLFVNNLGVLEPVCFVIYVKFKQEFLDNDNIISKIAYEDRHKFLKNRAAIVVEAIKNDENFVVDEIIEKIGGIL